jgi:polysaccharide export outer membrane protein
MNRTKQILLFFACIIVFFSCVSHKKTTLVQNKTTSIKDTLYNYKFVYKILPQDILLISITSFNQKTTDFFNMKTSDQNNDPVGIGYKVSNEGYIVVPILDSVQVKGLTIMETQQKITKLMGEYISDAYVLVDLANFSISCLGDIKFPGVKVMPKDATTMLEALALAGDFGDYANRQNVKVLRTIEGKTTVAILDFTDVKIVESPYFYVMPNDVIYVESLKVKTLRSNLSQITLFVSLTSLVVVLINVSRSFK